MIKKNDGNPFAPVTRKAVESTTSVEADSLIEVPKNVNTIKEILEWVGEDQDKAILVLESEETSDKPRTTLVEKLEEIING